MQPPSLLSTSVHAASAWYLHGQESFLFLYLLLGQFRRLPINRDKIFPTLHFLNPSSIGFPSHEKDNRCWMFSCAKLKLLFIFFLLWLSYFNIYANRMWHIGISVCSEFFDLNESFHISGFVSTSRWRIRVCLSEKFEVL